MNKYFIKKTFCMLLSVTMLLGMLQGSIILADNYENSIDIIVSANINNDVKVFNKKLNVKYGTAEKYGISNSSNTDYVGQGDITVLDALVSIHENYYGSQFTKQAIKNYLTVEDNNFGSKGVFKLFCEPTEYFSFAVNGFSPNDGNYGEWGALSFAIDQAVLNNGDYLKFFTYQDQNYWADNYLFGSIGLENNSKPGKEKIEFDVLTNKEIKFNVNGYSICYSGNQPLDVIGANTAPAKGIQLYTINDSMAVTKIENAITDENGNATLKFNKPGIYKVVGCAGNESVSKYIPLEVTFNVSDSAVPDDFANDLFLQYDYKHMKIGDSAKIFPRRVIQLFSQKSDRKIERPEFTYEIVYGDSVNLTTFKSNDDVDVTAVKEGLTLVKVSYNSMIVDGVTYGACSKVNQAYVAFYVNDDIADIAIKTSINQTSYDTIYFAEGNTVSYDATITSPNAKTRKVTLNGIEVTSSNDKYTFDLENRQNVLVIEAFDANGKSNVLVKTLDARKISYTITNETNPSKEIVAGDNINISFKGITNPVPKFNGIYNPTWFSEQHGNKGTYVSYKLGENNIVGACNQYDLDVTNTIALKAPNTDFTLTNGAIFTEWWGDTLGQDKLKDNNQAPNLSANKNQATLCSMPDIKVSVKAASQLVNKKKVALKNVKPNKLTTKTKTISGVTTAKATIKLQLKKVKKYTVNGKKKTKITYKTLKTVSANKKGKFVINKLKLKKYKGKTLRLLVSKSKYISRIKVFRAIKK